MGVAELALRTTKSLVQEDNRMSEPEVEQKLRVSKQQVVVVDRSFKRTLEKEVEAVSAPFQDATSTEKSLDAASEALNDAVAFF